MSDSLKIETNGKHKVPWVPVVTVLWGLLIGLFYWTAQREIGRSESRIEKLEDTVSKSENSISVTTRLREEDRKILDELLREQKETSKLVARIAERMGVREQP